MDLLKWLSLLLKDQIGVLTRDTMVVTQVSDIDAVIPEFWAEGVMEDANRESFWGSLSGKEGSMMPVIDKTGPLREKGDQLSISVIAQLMGSGVTGEAQLIGQEESLSVGTFTVTCDVVRHAVGITRKATKQANFDQVKMAGSLLKDWMTRKMDNDAFSTILTNVSDTIYANSRSAEGNLTEAGGDTFSPYEITLLRLALQRNGAMPIRTKKVNGRTVGIYGCVFGEVDRFRLRQNTGFLQEIREALVRFDGKIDHPIFQGALGIYDNVLLYEYSSVNPLPQGTPLRPETIVFVTLTTTATSITVGDAAAPSAGATPNYTEFFASSGSLQIEDEIMSYTAKTNNTFTGITRSVSSTTAVSHNQNKMVTQRQVSSVIGFGAEALCRAIGDSPEPIGQDRDYKEMIGLGIRAYYGQALKKDKRRGKTSGAVVLKCFSKNPSASV